MWRLTAVEKWMIVYVAINTLKQGQESRFPPCKWLTYAQGYRVMFQCVQLLGLVKLKKMQNSLIKRDETISYLRIACRLMTGVLPWDESGCVVGWWGLNTGEYSSYTGGTFTTYEFKERSDQCSATERNEVQVWEKPTSRKGFRALKLDLTRAHSCSARFGMQALGKGRI